MEWLFPLSALIVLGLTIPVAWFLRRVDLRVATSTAGSRGAEAASSDLNALVQDCVRATLTVSQRTSSATAPYRLKMNLGDVLPVKITAVDLRSALSEILKNAEKRVPLGGTIEVATGVDAEHVYVSIGETGVVEAGMPRATTGAGIGLAVAVDVVRRHSGEIEYKSAPDSGSRTVIRLPAETREGPKLEASTR